MFYKVVEKQNPYLKTDVGIAFVSAMQYIISIKGSDGSMLEF
jgi:hypothetical protein